MERSTDRHFASASSPRRRPPPKEFRSERPGGRADDIMRILRDTLGIEIPSTQTNLIETGLLDSLAVVTLVVELEQVTGIQIPFETLEVDALSSVDAISDLIDRLEQGAT